MIYHCHMVSNAETVLLALLHNKKRHTVSQFLLYLVVPPFGLWLWATWLSLGHEGLWLNLEVLLLWAHQTEINYLSPLETFIQYNLISSASTWKLKTSLFVNQDTSPSQEHLWYKWRYINIWLQLQCILCVHSIISCVRASHEHTHGLEGTVLTTLLKVFVH